MARAGYIYLVYLRDRNWPIAAFTVKYEAFDWCRASNYSNNDVHVERMRDGNKEHGEKESIIVRWEDA